MADVAMNTISAEHPLLDKFQVTLKQHLLRKNEQLTKENAEIDCEIQRNNDEREDIGAKIFDLQRTIDHQKTEMVSYNQQMSQTFEKRVQCEENIRQVKLELKLLHDFHRDAKRTRDDRMAELKKLQSLEQTIDKWQQEMDHNLKVSKLMLNKDKQEKDRIVKKKREMDFLLLNLEMELMKTDEKSTEITQDIREHEQQIEQLNAKLTCSNADLDALQTDNRRLISSWNEVIQAIANRDTLLAKTANELRKETEDVKVIQNDIETTKKDAAKHMEENESLEQFQRRLAEDLQFVIKKYEKAMHELTKLNGNIEKYSKLIVENEHAFHQASVENNLLEGDYKSLLREYERHINEKINQENQILEQLQEQVTTDQASKKRGRNIRDMQSKRRNMELMMNNTESQLSEILFEMEKLKGISARCRSYADDLIKEQMVFEQKAKDYDRDLQIIKRAIEEKLKLHDRLNKQLAKLIEMAGGNEDDPLQRKIKMHEISIEELETEIKEYQNSWLHLQCNIVSMSEKLTQIYNDTHLARQQLLVIEQKTLKVDNELMNIQNTDQKLIRDIKNLDTKLDLLSAKLYDKKQCNATEMDQCQFVHQKIIGKLQEDETSVLQLEAELVTISKDIEEMKRAVLNRHHETLTWETRWKMTKEAKRQNDEEYAKTGEIGAMTMEIRRMEVRLSELKRAQEKLVSDMELCVHHRVHIFDQANMRNKLPHKKSKCIDTTQYRFNQLQAKLVQAKNELNTIEKQIGNLVAEHGWFEAKLDKLKQDIHDDRMKYALLQNEVEQALLMKQENLELIVCLQNRVKRYRSVIQKPQIPKNRAESIITMQFEQNMEINISLVSILDDLIDEFPEHKFSFQRIRQTLKD